MTLGSSLESYAYYRQTFPEQVAAFEKQNGDVVEKAQCIQAEEGEEEAEEFMADTLKTLRHGIGGANSARELGGVSIALGCVIQALGGRMGLQLEGKKASLIDQVAANEEAYSTIAKELLCKYGGAGLLEPEARLALLTMSCIGSVHVRNSCAARLEADAAAGPPRSGKAQTPGDAAKAVPAHPAGYQAASYEAGRGDNVAAEGYTEQL